MILFEEDRPVGRESASVQLECAVGVDFEFRVSLCIEMEYLGRLVGDPWFAADHEMGEIVILFEASSPRPVD